jgi:hypothetical protein
VKIASKKEFVKFIKKHGFYLSGGSKHEKWVFGSKVILLPRTSKDFSRIMGERLLKEAGLWQKD